MKKVFTLFFVLMLTVVSVFAQVPQKMSYQAVVRNASNSLVANQNVSVRISVLQGSSSGATAYMETHTVSTNANGLMTVTIGEGTTVSGTFSDIDWANGPFYLKSEIDPDGGINYNVTSVQQLLSVPYALYAQNAGNVQNLENIISDLQQAIQDLQNQIDELSHEVTYADDALPGVFSISATQTVKFSKGNLQYIANTNTWKFADNQYDYFGTTQDDSGRDLFGWGDLTGTNTSTNYGDYSWTADWARR